MVAAKDAEIVMGARPTAHAHTHTCTRTHAHTHAHTTPAQTAHHRTDRTPSHNPPPPFARCSDAVGAGGAAPGVPDTDRFYCRF